MIDIQSQSLISVRADFKKWGVSISKFLLCGRMAPNKTSPYFDRGSDAATPNIICNVGPPNVTPRIIFCFIIFTVPYVFKTSLIQKGNIFCKKAFAARLPRSK